MIESALKNLAINLKATGPAAVVSVWIIAMAALGLFGTSTLAYLVTGCLMTGGGVIIFALIRGNG